MCKFLSDKILRVSSIESNSISEALNGSKTDMFISLFPFIESIKDVFSTRRSFLIFKSPVYARGNFKTIPFNNPCSKRIGLRESKIFLLTPNFF